MSDRRRKHRARIGLGALVVLAHVACGGALPGSRHLDAGADTDATAPGNVPSDPDVAEVAAVISLVLHFFDTKPS